MLSRRTRAVAALTALALALVVGLAWTRPPAPRPAAAPAREASAARAFAHVVALAQRPRPPGSPAHDAARAYLLAELRALGLTPEVQDTLASPRRAPHRLARVRNVLARLPGTRGSGPAVLLVAHYDSRGMTPGAADDAMGVAAVLEALRALALDRPPADVIALFTDGEEGGLLGAQAFVAEHRWVKDAGVVVNLEARGNTGPAHVFQTSAENGALIRTLASAASLPAASSLSQTVYTLLPNDTDLSVFLPRTPSLNIAAIGDVARYHAPTDTPDNLDRGTLQQEANLALSLARAFASGPLPPPREPDAAYFDAGPLFVRYPGALTLPLAALAALACAAFLALGLRRGALRAGRVALAALAALAAPALVAALVALLFALATALHPSYALLLAARPALGHAYLGAFLLLASAVVLTLQRLFARPAEAFAGAALVYAALALGAALTLPGVAFLFTWPLLLALPPALALLLTGGFEAASPRALALAVTAALPGVVILAPLVPQLGDAFGLSLAPAPPALAALLLTLAAPALHHLPDLRRWAAGLGAAAYLGALALPPFDAAHPRPDSLFLAVDADTGQATWASPDDTLDAWTSPVLAPPARTPLHLPFPLAERTPLFTRAAGPVVEAAPEIVWLAARGAERQIRLVPPPGAEELAVELDGDVRAVHLGDRRVSSAFRFHAPPPEGLTLRVTLGGEGPLTVRVLSRRPGFPAGLTGPGPRPAGVMARPGMMPPWDELLESDGTVVGRSASR
jgi:hypothetical protein